MKNEIKRNQKNVFSVFLIICINFKANYNPSAYVLCCEINNKKNDKNF